MGAMLNENAYADNRFASCCIHAEQFVCGHTTSRLLCLRSLSVRLCRQYRSNILTIPRTKATPIVAKVNATKWGKDGPPPL